MTKTTDRPMLSYSTGSIREDKTGKGAFHQIPTLALRRLAVHYERGAEKHGKDNWRLGQPLSVYWDAGLRHALAAKDGLTDEDHEAAWIWNAVAFLWTKDAIQRGELPSELDDLGVTNAPE